jgi:hypothetical protein
MFMEEGLKITEYTLRCYFADMSAKGGQRVHSQLFWLLCRYVRQRRTACALAALLAALQICPPKADSVCTALRAKI